MASAFRRGGSGPYIASWRDEHGKWRQTKGAASKADTERLARRLEREADQRVRQRVALDPFERHAAAPIADHVDAYVASLRQRGKSHEYVVQIEAIVRRVIQAADIHSIRDLDPVVLAEAIDGLPRLSGSFTKKTGPAKKPAPASERTKATYASRMRSFARWLVKAQRLKSNPLEALSFGDGAAGAGRVRRALTVAEAARLLAAAEARPEQELRTVRRGPLAGKRSPKEPPPRALARARLLGLRRKTIYLTVLWTGLRRNELASLAWGDLHLDDPQPAIQLRAQTTKSKRAARLPVHPQLLAALQEWRRSQVAAPAAEATVFEALPDMKAFRADLKAAQIPFEVPGRGVLDFHALRTSFGTLLATIGVPLRVRQAAMRHANPRLTETVYLDEDLLPLFEHVTAAPAIALAK